MKESQNRIPEHLRAAETYMREMVRDHLPEHFAYHSIEHMMDVTYAVQEIAAHSGVTEKDRDLLILAALFHDTGLVGGYQEHEKRSCDMVAQYMAANGWFAEDIAAVKNMIEATRMPQTPESLLQKILCDADLYHLGRPDFEAVSARLRKEFELMSGKVISEEVWVERNLAFLQAHKYFTAYGQDTLEQRKQKNLQKLKERVGEQPG